LNVGVSTYHAGIATTTGVAYDFKLISKSQQYR